MPSQSGIFSCVRACVRACVRGGAPPLALGVIIVVIEESNFEYLLGLSLTAPNKETPRMLAPFRN